MTIDDVKNMSEEEFKDKMDLPTLLDLTCQKMGTEAMEDLTDNFKPPKIVAMLMLGGVPYAAAMHIAACYTYGLMSVREHLTGSFRC